MGARTGIMPLYLAFVAFYFFVVSTRYCNASQCRVCLPQDVPPDSPCSAARNAELSKNKQLYNLKSSEPMHPFLLSHKTPEELTEFIKKDPFIRYYGMAYRGMAQINKHLRETYIAKHAEEGDVTNDDEYKKLGQFFKQTGHMMIGEYGWMVSEYEPFMLDMNDWIEDMYFTQQRLAGGNPMSLRLVSQDGPIGINWAKLKENLNPNFNWEKAVQEVVGVEIPIEEGLQEKRLFVLRYEECDGMNSTTEVVDHDPRRKLRRTLSPIALFVSMPVGPVELKPVAIQMDYTPDSSVFTPKDGGQWMLAKLNVQATDAAYLEIVEHLAKTHFFIEPFCIIMWRTLPSQHPLNQMLRYHCRGITIPSTFGGPKTINPDWFMHRLFGCGWEGALHMMREIHPKLSWDITDLRKNIRDRGLDDKNKVPYFPYRDDGEIVLESIETVVNSYVNLYYKTNDDVKQDVEIQAFANEMSIDGKTGPTGGLGQVKGFPAKFNSKTQLKNVLSAFIWQVSPQHVAVGFALPEYALYIPNLPTRLYDDTRVEPGTFSILNLPNRNVSAWATNLMMNVGRFRWDSLFDYGNKLEDHKARQVLYKQHYKILKTLQPKLETINKRRKDSTHLTYPYFLPRWLPNGIQV